MKMEFFGSKGIKKELIAGFAAVVIFSSLISYLIILIWTRSSFDDLVKANDVEVADEYARILGEFYTAHQSWEGLELYLREYGRTLPEGEESIARTDDRRHPKDHDLPLIVLDNQGRCVYTGISPRDDDEDPVGKLKLSQGTEILSDGAIAGYVYFKSMIFRSYNPQEQAFLISLAKSLGLSVLVGLILSLILGTTLAARFARPIILLDEAVKRIAEGDRNAQVEVTRRDEIGSLADSFNQMSRRLKLTEEARQNLLADIAHELRTPVSILQANLEMILEGVYTADKQKLKSLYKETVLMTSLIKDLRSLSDLEVGITEMEPERIGLSSFVHDTCVKYAPLFREKGIALEYDLDDTLWIYADEDKIRQVLGNLLGNALKYAPESTKVVIRTEKYDKDGITGQARITVSDEGTGVPEDSLDKIFDRFYRVDQSRSRQSGGRGLGLAISKRIVEMSRGRMGACQNEPRGLSVWFSLPCSEKSCP